MQPVSRVSLKRKLLLWLLLPQLVLWLSGGFFAWRLALQNGDLVRITFDASAVPLDFAWQGKARSKSSRRKIRTELRRRAAAIHPGRGRFKDELIHKLDVYQHDINHRREDADTIVSLIPTTADIDHFLRRSALRLGLATPDFLSGSFRFGGTSTQEVSNAGALQARDGGYIALLGARVSNSGTLEAHAGSVNLAAGQAVTRRAPDSSVP